MIGSHDTYTFLKARNWAVNLLSKFWRCQSKDVQEQYDFGVRFFDIRVFRDGDVWRTAHGLAEFNQTFKSLNLICLLFSDSMFRIWLEKGSDEDWIKFRDEALECKDRYPGFVQAYRKFKYPLFTKDYLPLMVYYCCEMEKASNIVSGLWSNPIKKWAQKHNPVITQAMIDDPNVIYFMDYV